MIKYKIGKNTQKKQGTVAVFELATYMTVDKRLIYYAMNSPCDWYGHITF